MDIVSFNNLVKNNKIVLIDFFASWCGPCKMLTPIIHEIEEEMHNIKVVKIDVDEDAELAKKFSVMSIPTVFLFKEGKQVASFMGFRPKIAIIQ
jgi:thioredoxin 1